MLEVKDLNKNYGKHHVLKDITFTVNKGEIVGFIGPNGAGKSTTMKCIVRLVFPEKGEISIGGYKLDSQPQKALGKISALIEAPGIYPNLTGLDNLNLFAGLRNVSKKRVEEVINIIKLGAGINKLTKRYSMGMKQRLGLGIALLSEPEYLILDEPFVGLDPQGIFELRNVLLEIAKNNVAILVSSHQLLELEKISTRNIFIKNGQMVNKSAIDQEELSLAYKISFLENRKIEQKDGSELIEKALISKYEFNDEHGLLWLKSRETLSPVLENLIQKGYQIQSVAPIDKDLESLYKQIY